METQTTTGNKRKGKGTAGRVNPDGQEAVTRPKMVTDKIDELETLQRKAQEAGKDFNEAVKALAEVSGYNASAIKRLVTARLGESFKEKVREAEQQLELFTEVGE